MAFTLPDCPVQILSDIELTIGPGQTELSHCIKPLSACLTMRLRLLRAPEPARSSDKVFGTAAEQAKNWRKK